MINICLIDYQVILRASKEIGSKNNINMLKESIVCLVVYLICSCWYVHSIYIFY